MLLMLIFYLLFYLGGINTCLTNRISLCIVFYLTYEDLKQAPKAVMFADRFLVLLYFRDVVGTQCI